MPYTLPVRQFAKQLASLSHPQPGDPGARLRSWSKGTAEVSQVELAFLTQPGGEALKAPSRSMEPSPSRCLRAVPRLFPDSGYVALRWHLHSGVIVGRAVSDGRAFSLQRFMPARLRIQGEKASIFVPPRSTPIRIAQFS